MNDFSFNIIAKNLTQGVFTAVDKSVGRLESRFGTMAAAGARAFATVGFAATAAGGALAYSMKGAFDEFDRLSKQSQAIGLTTEELSRLTWAADLSGVGFEKLTGGVGKLAKSISDSLRSSTSEQALAFKTLGINVLDAEGNMLSTGDVIQKVAGRFAEMRNGTEKTSLAMALFGRSGKELIPLLNAGAGGLAKMAEESDRLGLTVSTKTGKAAEEFNDTWNRIGKTLTGVRNVLAEEMLPALQKDADWLNRASSGAVRFIRASASVIDSIQGVAKAAREQLGIEAFFDKYSLNLLGGPSVIEQEARKAGDIARQTITETMNKPSPRVTFTIGLQTRMGAGPMSGVADQLRAQADALTRELSRSLNTSNDIVDPWLGLRESTASTFDQVARQADQFASGLTSSFTSPIMSAFDSLIGGTFKFGDALSNLAGSVGRFLLQSGLSSLGSLFSGGFGASVSPLNFNLMSAGFGGLFGNGGSLRAGEWGIAGETGEPELITGPATITPMSKLSSSRGGDLRPVFNISGGNGNPEEVAQRVLERWENWVRLEGPSWVRHHAGTSLTETG